MFGKDRHAVDHAADRCADVEPVELLAQGAAAFGEFQFVILQVAQPGDRLFPAGGFESEDLDVDLGHPFARLCGGGGQFPHAAQQIGLFPLQGEHAAGLRQPPVEQVLLVCQLFLDQRLLAFQRGLLRGNAGQLAGDLGALLGQLFLGTLGRFVARLEEPFLPVHQVGRLGPAFEKHLRKLDVETAVPLCLEPAPAGEYLVKLAFDDGEFGFQDRTVEPDQHVARGNGVAFIDEDFLDHPAIGMLDHLPVAVDLDLAGCDDGAGDLRQNGPAAEAAHEDQQGDETDGQGTARRPALRGIVAHDTPPAWPFDWVISLAFFSTSRMTSSLGPKARRAPPSITSKVSHS